MEVLPPHSLHPFLANGANWVTFDGVKNWAEFGETAAAPHIQAVIGMLEHKTGSLSPTITLPLLVTNSLFLVAFAN